MKTVEDFARYEEQRWLGAVRERGLAFRMLDQDEQWMVERAQEANAKAIKAGST